MGNQKLKVLLTPLVLFVLLLCLTNCSNNLPGDDLTPSTPAAQASRTIRATPSETVMAKPTITEVEPSSSPTIAPTQASTPTPVLFLFPTQSWTPIPTLVPEQVEQLIEDYYANVSNCEIPCWWNITPGQTTWAEARQILSPLNTEAGLIIRTGLTKYYYTFEEPTELNPVGFELVVWLEEDRVIAVQMNSKSIKTGLDTSLAGLLKLFGQPEQIWVRINADSSNNEAPYELELFYPNQGVLILDNGLAFLTDKSVLLCPQKKDKRFFPPRILLFSRQDYKDYEKLAWDLYGDRTAGISTLTFRQLSTLTDGFGEEEFFQNFSDRQSEACIVISIEKLNQ